MRYVDRSQVSEPRCLESADKNGKTERDRARDYQNAPGLNKGAFAFSVYKHDEVKKKLAMLFHGKCAYCETFFSASAPVDIEHYRPKGSISEAPGHPGYWWLAMSWNNLLPSCIDCNRRRKQNTPNTSTSLHELFASSIVEGKMPSLQSGKQDSFPIKNSDRRLNAESYLYRDEEPFLLNPTQDDPRQHLRYHIDHHSPLGIILAGQSPGQTSERGAVSIQVYGLNRLGLVQDRTRLLRRLEFLGDQILEIEIIIEELEVPPMVSAIPQPTMRQILSRLKLLQQRTISEIREMAQPTSPYSEMVQAWIDDFSAQIST